MGYILFLKIQAAVARKKRDLSPDLWQLIESLDLLVMKGKLIFSWRDSVTSFFTEGYFMNNFPQSLIFEDILLAPNLRPLF